MVAFGKKLKERQIQEWQGYYINYKLMKKKVKQYARQIEAGGLERRYVLKDFSRMLDNQIEKIVLFLLEQQGLLASRLSKLGEEQESLHEEPDISKISDLREAYRAVGRDLLQLLYFVEINAIGLRKILKKFDKRFGYRFTDYYVKTRANHPYSQLQQVFKHVGLGAVVGAVSRNLADLQDRQGSYLSIYDQPVLSLQVSFVNSISTIKGGIHVDYVTNQIFNHVMNLVNKKNKNVNLKAYIVENHLWVFVNALIDNPTFDSHTKETLTIRQSSFGSKCEPSQEFLKKVAKSGVVKSLLSWADYKQSKDLKNTNGAKRERITGITKLEDVNDAGGKNSAKYTLILTEGDSS